MRAVSGARAGERGTVLFLVVMLLPALAALSVSSLDLGHLLASGEELRTAAEAGALAGAGELLAVPGDLGRAEDAALAAAGRNLAPGPGAAVSSPRVRFLRNGRPDEAHPDQVEVVVERREKADSPLETLGRRLLGRESPRLGGKARAGIVDGRTVRLIVEQGRP